MGLLLKLLGERCSLFPFWGCLADRKPGTAGDHLCNQKRRDCLRMKQSQRRAELRERERERFLMTAFELLDPTMPEVLTVDFPFM